MKINICHLYPDLLNLYGDTGNISILSYRAKKRGIDVNIIPVTIGDKFCPNNYDIIFLCGGQDYEQSIVSNDIRRNKRDLIEDYINSSKVFIAICGGYQLLGNYYELIDGTKIEGLGILDIYTKAYDERCVGNIIIKNEQYDEIYVGFENHAGRTYINDLKPLGKCLYGYGNNAQTKDEGCIYKNTFCSYIHGPILSKNPELADRILKIALNIKYDKFDFKDLDDTIELNTKQELIEKFLNNNVEYK